MLADEELKDAAVLVYANKQDQGVMSMSEIAQILSLANLRNRKWFIQGTCALSGEGIFEGLEWLANALRKRI